MEKCSEMKAGNFEVYSFWNEYPLTALRGDVL